MHLANVQRNVWVIIVMGTALLCRSGPSGPLAGGREKRVAVNHQPSRPERLFFSRNIDMSLFNVLVLFD